MGGKRQPTEKGWQGMNNGEMWHKRGRAGLSLITISLELFYRVFLILRPTQFIE